MFLPDPLYLAVAATAIASPGPGVVFSLSNAVRYGLAPALGGILGLACGSLIIAGVSATGVGVLLVATPSAYGALKFAGASYLIYLAWRLWHATPVAMPAASAAVAASMAERFREGFTMQLSNPKALVFFIALFPRFLEGADSIALRFVQLMLGYAVLLLIIHGAFALAARQVQRQMVAHSRVVNRVSATAFVGFALVIAFG